MIWLEEFWWRHVRPEWATWWRAALSGCLAGWLEPFPGRTTTCHRLPAALILFKRAIAAIEKVSWREKGQNILGGEKKRWLGKGISNELIGSVKVVRRKLSDHWQLAIQGEKKTGSGWDLGIEELREREEQEAQGRKRRGQMSVGEIWEWSLRRSSETERGEKRKELKYRGWCDDTMFFRNGFQTEVLQTTTLWRI